MRLPLGLMVAVTGVSGSGKSSLVFDILDRSIRQRLFASSDIPGEHDAIEGIEYLDKIITIDQEHIGRIPRSNAATYSDAFTPIRQAFAAMPGAKALGCTARHFSFNVPGGRCERCQGAGVLTVSMHFLPDVEVRCPACRGRRFKNETLQVCYREHDKRHTETDEVFVLLGGRGVLILGGNGAQVSGIYPQAMEYEKIYNVKRNAWHTILMSRDACVLLVENRDTGSHNSEYSQLTQEQRGLILEEARQAQIE